MYVFQGDLCHTTTNTRLYLCPGPTCKKMQDLRPNTVFQLAAFMPTRDEVRAACRAAKSRPPRARSPPAKKRKIEIIDLDSASDDSDSDDDMPDLATLLRSSPKDLKDQKANADAKKPSNGRKGGKGKGKEDESDSDEDMDSSDSDVDSKGRKARRGKAKSKNDADDDRDISEPPPPDMDQYKMWQQGGSNVEASAKMLQMIAYLKEWESLGDKTIVFSQCVWSRLSRVSLCRGVDSDRCGWCRDVDAGFVRADLCAPWD